MGKRKKKRDPVEKRSVLFTSMSYRDGQSADCVIAACFADDKLMLPGIYYGRRKSGWGDGGGYDRSFDEGMKAVKRWRMGRELLFGQ